MTIQSQISGKDQNIFPIKLRDNLGQKLIQRQFKVVIESLRGSQHLSRDQRYALGFAQLKQGELYQAALSWAPLVGKLGLQFDRECRDLMISLFASSPWQTLEWQNYALESLINIFIVTRTLIRDHSQLQPLRLFVFAELWRQGSPDALDQLLRLLESKKEPADSITLINIAKLRQRLGPSRNEFENFAGLYLTAIATFIANRFSSTETAGSRTNLLESLAKPLRDLAVDQPRPSAWQAWIQLHLDILSLVIAELKSDDLPQIVVAPQFFANLSSSSPYYSRAERFVKSLSNDLQGIYSPIGTQVLKIQAGVADEKMFSRFYKESPGLSTVDLKLRLAVGAIQYSVDAAYALFQKVMPKGSAPFPISLNNYFSFIFSTLDTTVDLDHELFSNFISANAWDAKNRAVLSDLFHRAAAKKYTAGQCWTTDLAAANLLSDDSQTLEQIKCFLQRLTPTNKFLDNLQSGKVKRVYKHIWSKNVTKAELEQFLSLIFESITLTKLWDPRWREPRTKQSLDEIFALLIKSRVINAMIPIGKCIQAEAGCPCEKCEQRFWREGFMNVLRPFVQPNVEFPFPKPRAQPDQEMSERRYKSNPFEDLGLGRNSNKQEILRKTMEMMRLDSSKMPIYRLAQAELFDLKRRAAHEFNWYLEIDPYGV